MAIYSPVRSRRTAARQAEKTRQFITFRLRQEWFALPIYAVQKVIQMGKVYGDPQGTGISLTNYQGQEIIVVDVARRIFGETSSVAGERKHSLSSVVGEVSEPRFMLLVQSNSGEIVGLPVDSTPAMRRVPESAFTPIPKTYMAQGNIRCISSTTIQLSDHPPLFLLEANQLAEPQQIVGL
ncbi:MAG: chemotaxis protein CheW [Hydrococcus sp. C42_A2020_068]|uniref:chemotaxis protein CheW n=1 Tax=Pleurocapsa sp. PCC 7327 TaxID=118163 RepID=UPI00029FA951|nr:chemotaxis protein CheW [Pleurocapsa sp. PCC 7327]AFY76938.1 chemotaxis signal transduction protein [Pleurocapsa sp. PCC 7327]MBF2019515.1 chemotaxis protein CheW [Hydrococcus sp. C42_A2020_068]